MDFWTIVWIMVLLMPALWVASIIVQVGLMVVVFALSCIINACVWATKKLRGSA